MNVYQLLDRNMGGPNLPYFSLCFDPYGSWQRTLWIATVPWQTHDLFNVIRIVPKLHRKYQTRLKRLQDALTKMLSASHVRAPKCVQVLNVRCGVAN